MCNCSSNCKCLNSTVVPRGKQGDPGIDGRDGIYGGFAGKWTYNGSVSPTVPTMLGTYQLRFNDSDSADVTEIYVSKTGNYAIDFSDFLASFDNSGSYGRIRIFKEYDSTHFWMGEITSVTDSGVYYTLGVTPITYSSSVIPTTMFISPIDNIVMEFTQNAVATITDVTSAFSQTQVTINDVSTRFPLFGSGVTTSKRGYYIAWFEADISTSANEQNTHYEYYFYEMGAPNIAIGGNGGNTEKRNFQFASDSTPVDGIRVKISHNTILQGGVDTQINVCIKAIGDATNDVYITNRSLILMRIS